MASALRLPPRALADDDFIVSTCNKTSNAAQCAAVLSADPQSAGASTAHDLAGIVLDIAIASDSGGVINDMAKKSKGTREGDALNICDGAYSEATCDLDIDARDSFGFGQYADASRLVSGAKGGGDTCEKAFAGIGVEPSPVADVDRRMTERCDVAGNLIDLLVA